MGEKHEETKKRILVVDDEIIDLKMLKMFCENLGYEVVTAGNGLEAIEKTLMYKPDLILMDIIMPGMDGFEAIEKLKKNPRTFHVPIIIATSLSSKQDIFNGISKGASDYLVKPVDFMEFSLRVKNQLKIKEAYDIQKKHNEILESEVNDRTRILNEALEQLHEASNKIRIGYIDTINRLSMVSEYRDENSGAHIRRTGFYARTLAEELKLDKEFINNIFFAAPMHDIGKVAIPDDILLKDGPLNEEEWKTMASHTTIGAKILSGSPSPYLKMAEEIALTHHERWDGSGYPIGLKEEDIPVSGRIMFLSDLYDALRCKRPYKAALDHEKVLKIITEGDKKANPKHFDPDILEIFKKSHNKFKEIYNSFLE